MGRARRAIVGLAFVILIGTLPPVASAEFSSSAKKSSGEGELLELTLEAGGATIACQAYKAASSKAPWTIFSEGKEATKGAGLRLKLEKWGECTGKSSEIKQTTAELGTCELEVNEPKEETEVQGKLVTTCTIKFASCELKIEAKENEKLKNATLYGASESLGSLVIETKFTNVATSTKGTCPGIKATKEGKLQGFLEAKQAHMGPVPEFAIFIIAGSSSHLTTLQTTTTVGVRRESGAMAKLSFFSELQTVPNRFTPEQPRRKECEEFPYKVLDECTYKLTYNAVGNGSDILIAGGINKILAIQLVTGVP